MYLPCDKCKVLYVNVMASEGDGNCFTFTVSEEAGIQKKRLHSWK